MAATSSEYIMCFPPAAAAAATPYQHPPPTSPHPLGARILKFLISERGEPSIGSEASLVSVRDSPPFPPPRVWFCCQYILPIYIYFYYYHSTRTRIHRRWVHDQIRRFTMPKVCAAIIGNSPYDPWSIPTVPQRIKFIVYSNACGNFEKS